MNNLPFDRRSLHEAYASGLDPEAVIAEAYRRLEVVADPGIFLHLVDMAEAMAAAAALGPFDPVRLPLYGLPFAIKDNIDLAGAPTTAGCPAFAYRPTCDAAVVANLRRAGAIPIGKTNLDQFATGLVGVRTPYPIPRNALDPAIVPGGSSSGSAVAVAHGIVTFALGTDTAGSGRVPAALNNIVGLKPTLGLLSNTGVVPACRTLDTVSIFALTAEDAHAAFSAAANFDPTDAFARPLQPAPWSVPPSAFRLGVPTAESREFFGDTVQAASYAAALDDLRALGAEIEEIDFQPFFEVAALLYEGAWIAERYTVLEALLRERPETVYPVTREIIGAAERLSAADAFRGIYRLAELKRRAEPILARVDCLAVPSIPTFYSVAALAADPLGPNARLGTYTNFVNLMDLAGIAVPTRARSDGRPGSVTLLAPAGGDGRLAGLASALHRRSAATLGATGWPLPEAVFQPAEAGSDEIALAVVGAHMSGLPLNPELTRRGARFLEKARTAPCYRLYALPGGPPARPGLVRTASGGAAIALEIWALPKAGLADFMAGVPQPLAIGTLTLDDGSTVKGFLAEEAATQGAQDITAMGGWRAFLETQRATSGSVAIPG
jgi:allophanate hydrolase